MDSEAIIVEGCPKSVGRVADSIWTKVNALMSMAGSEKRSRTTSPDHEEPELSLHKIFSANSRPSNSMAPTRTKRVN